MSIDRKLLKDVNWIEAPGHPQLNYSIDGDNIIIKHYGNHILTTWDKIERLIVCKHRLLDNPKTRNKAAYRRLLNSFVPSPATRPKRDGVSLFIKLVEEGAIQREAPLFFSELVKRTEELNRIMECV